MTRHIESGIWASASSQTPSGHGALTGPESPPGSRPHPRRGGRAAPPRSAQLASRHCASRRSDRQRSVPTRPRWLRLRKVLPAGTGTRRRPARRA
jgi:hypothetical protein